MSSVPQILAPNSPRQQPTKVLGKHFDYVLRCGAIANGAQTPEIELLIEPGAPFCLRGIGAYSITAGVVTELAGAFLQYTDSQDNWLQTTLIGTSGDWSTGGFQAQYEPVYNQLVYGPGSVLSVRLQNLSGADWADTRIIFRGTKLYYKERIYSECYPDCYNALPWEQVLPITIAGGAGSRQIPSIPIIANGGDVVIRGATIAFDDPALAGDLAFRLRDQYEWPYSNDFIHFAWLFPQNLSNRPGVIYPEIYVPKDRMILIDALKAAASETFICNLDFVGSRIWPK